MAAVRVNPWRDQGPMGGKSRGWECRVYKHSRYPIELRHHYGKGKKAFRQYIVRTTGEVFIDDLYAAIQASDTP